MDVDSRSHQGESHSPHWTADHTDEWIKEDNDTIHISAKALNIIWGKDSRFWQWVKLSKEESCFEVGAELIQVNYIEVSGSLDLAKFNLTPSKAYEIIYKVKFKVDAFGWHLHPITFGVISTDGHTSKTSQTLEPYRTRSHELQEIHGGMFTVPSDMKGKVEFTMCEAETAWWKGGMVLEGVKVKPHVRPHVDA